MPDRYGGGGDYSGQFAYLADTYLNNIERQAELADQRRETEQAARDSEVFARYDAGKIGGDQLLAYIRKRVAETAYDPKQQADWKKALLQYQESIADGNAAAAFEKSNDYNGYISYLKGKLAGYKGDPNKRAALEKQINDLIDQRDSQSVTRGAERIMLQISKGRASYSDLLTFYREKLNDTRNGSTVKAQIRSKITEVAQRVQADNLNLRIGALGDQFARHVIGPHEYGRKLKDLARSSGLQTSDPAQYNSMIQQADQLLTTVVDRGRLEEIQGKLLSHDMTPEEAMRAYYREAERYKVNDPKTYQAIRNQGYQIGHTPLPGETPLPNPGALGPLGGPSKQEAKQIIDQNVNKIFRAISQLDGSEFAQVNCVMASSAMLAWAMGYRDKDGKAITGADLRYLTGDREMGTNLDQAQSALAQLGITGLKNKNHDNISFDKFKARVGDHGQPAVLMGVYANMPANLRANPTLTRGHGIFIAAYDAKKDAFWVMDPAVSKTTHPDYKGQWMDASVIKNYGWGPSYTDSTGTYSFHGQVLMAPPGTIKQRVTADGPVMGRGTGIRYVNVDDQPVRADTPKRYSGLNSRGPSTVEPVGNETTHRNGKPKVHRAPTGYDTTLGGDTPDTVEEVKSALNASGKRLDIINQLSSAFNAGKDRLNIGGQEYVLNEHLMHQLDRETLKIYDRDIMYADAAGLETVLNDRFDGRTEFLANVAQRNSIDAAVITNTAIRDAKMEFDHALEDPDPARAQKSMQAIKARLHVLETSLTAGAKTATPLDDLSTDPKVTAQLPGLGDIIKLLDMVTEPSDVPINERMPDILDAMKAVGADPDQHDKDGNVTGYGNDLGNMVQKMLDQSDAQGRIDRGEAIAAIDGGTGKLGVVPLLPSFDPITGAEITTPYFGQDENGQNIKGVQVPVQGPTGVEMRWVRPGQTGPVGAMLLPAKNLKLADGTTLTKGVPLTEQQITALAQSGQLAQMIGGDLVEQPYTMTMVQMPGRMVDGKLVPGDTFIQDPGTRLWFQGSIPVTSFGAVGGRYIGMNGDLTPEFEWRPFSSAGMYPLPYQGDRKAIQDATDQGLVPIPQDIQGRDQFGGVTPDANTLPKFYTPYDPLANAWTGMNKVDSPDDRAERIEKAVTQIFQGVHRINDIQSQQSGYEQEWLRRQGRDPITGDPIGKTFDVPSGLNGFGNDPIHQYPQPQNPPESAGPQTSYGEIPSSWRPPDLTSLIGTGADLGLNIKPGHIQSLPGFFASNQAQSAKPAGYTPPAPKQTGKGTGKGTSPLPKVQPKVVMVGGTTINVPDTHKPEHHKNVQYKPPPPSNLGNVGKGQTGGGSNLGAFTKAGG